MAGKKKLVLVAAGSSAITALLFMTATSVFGQKWRSSGDGKTIFNYRTGELRYTASGRSVKEVRAAALKRYKLEDEQRSRERITREQRERSILEHKKLVHAHNSKIFHSLKYFSGNYPELGSYWSQITRPFRVNQLLTRREHANLLDFLGRAVANGPHKNDLGIMSAINQLNSWDLTYSK